MKTCPPLSDTQSKQFDNNHKKLNSSCTEDTNGIVNSGNVGSANPEDNACASLSQEIIIQRLENQIQNMMATSAAKEKELDRELSSWKEAYRRCLADYEAEKETKNTLQQCLDTLQKTNNRNKKNFSSPGQTCSLQQQPQLNKTIYNTNPYNNQQPKALNINTNTPYLFWTGNLLKAARRHSIKRRPC